MNLNSNTKPPRVFVVHEPLKKTINPRTKEVSWERIRDLSAAREFGELVYVYSAGHLSQDPDFIAREAWAKLTEFSDNDYLLPSGDVMAIVAASAVASSMVEGNSIKVLSWDKRQGKYFASTIPIWKYEPDEVPYDTEVSLVDTTS